MPPPRPLGLVLAGGLSRRMGGGDKPLRPLAGRTILERVVARLAPQCDGIIVSANGDPARFASLGLPVVADATSDHPGPLAGILAGLDWAARHRPDLTHVASVAGDTPFLPRDFVARLVGACDAGAVMAHAVSGGRAHPVDALWSVGLRDAIRAALAAGERRVGMFAARHGTGRAEWPAAPVDPFFNVNAPQDLAAAEDLIGRVGEP